MLLESVLSYATRKSISLIDICNTGRNTAWSVYLRIGMLVYQACYSYEFDYLHNGFEDVAEKAFRNCNSCLPRTSWPLDSDWETAYESVWQWYASVEPKHQVAQ